MVTRGGSSGARFAGVAVLPIAVALTLALSAVSGVAAQEPVAPAATEADPSTAPPPQTPTAGNGIFRVRIDDGANLGAISVETGPDHPIGGGLPVLSRSGRAGSSFVTVRSFDSGVNYTQSATAPGVALAPGGTTTALGTTGFRTTYRVAGADRLRIVQDVDVQGSTVADTFVVVTTSVTNRGTTPARVGIRRLWDLQLLRYGAPSASRETGTTSTPLSTEQTLPTPLDDVWQVRNTNVRLWVAGSLGGGAANRFAGAPPSSEPDLAQLAAWPAAQAAPFRYTVPDPAGAPGDDSALLTYWGDRGTRALTVEPGATVSVSSFLHADQGRLSSPGPPRGRPLPIHRHHRLAALTTPAAATVLPVTSASGVDARGDARYTGGDLVGWDATGLVDGFRLGATTRAGYPFESSPWRFGLSNIQWVLDPEGDGLHFTVAVFGRWDHAWASVFDGYGQLACRVTPTFATPEGSQPAAGHYAVTVPSSCLGDPAAVRVWVGAGFERYPFIEKPPFGVDYSPDSGWSPWIGLTAP